MGKGAPEISRDECTRMSRHESWYKMSCRFRLSTQPPRILRYNQVFCLYILQALRACADAELSSWIHHLKSITKIVGISNMTLMYPIQSLRPAQAALSHERFSGHQPSLIRRFADQPPHRQTKPDQNQHSPFDLKRLGATPTVRLVVYAALGVAATAETAFWCSWGWAKMKGSEKPAEEA